MWDLSKHEQIEMETLDGLNSIRVLDGVVFCGGTMLRLCHELNRYSVDLDFWLLNKEREDEMFAKVKTYLKENFILKKSSHRKNSLLFEFSAKGYPRHLKIEIRKRKDRIKYEEKIAFSKHSTKQVFLKAETLDDMMKDKIDTFLDRVQIRDVFDIEFLIKQGIQLKATQKDLEEMRGLIGKFKAKDYRNTLGALLEFKERQFYKSANFRFLLSHIDKFLKNGRVGEKKNT